MGLLYGFAEGSLGELAVEIERAFDIQFELHESDMRGGDYDRHETGSELIILQCNRDNGDIAEEDSATMPFLLIIEGDARSTEAVGRCLGRKAVLLRGR